MLLHDDPTTHKADLLRRAFFVFSRVSLFPALSAEIIMSRHQQYEQNRDREKRRRVCFVSDFYKNNTLFVVSKELKKEETQ